MSAIQIVVSVVALIVGAIGMVMAFARTPPAEAAKNLKLWRDRVRPLDWPVPIAINRRVIAGYVGVVLVLGGCIGLFVPFRSAPTVETSNPPSPGPVVQHPPAPPPPPQKPPPENHQPTVYSGLTDAQLKSEIISVAGDLRSFEANYAKRRGSIAAAPWQYTTGEEHRREFGERQAKLDALDAEETKAFQQQLLPQVRALHLELVIRLNRSGKGATDPGNSGDGSIAFSSGILSPRAPLADLANWLEAYVRELQ
jgi:hypothetical protein